MTNSDERSARLKEAIRLKRAAPRTRAPELPARSPDRPARLGEMQRSLWLLHRLDPLSAAYNLSSAFRVSGALDVGRLERSLNQVVSRHRLLRSTFILRGDDVLQDVNSRLRLDVGVLAAATGELLTTAVDEARLPFDLESGPLLRLRLIEEPGGERLLLLVLHHILADERSLGFFWRELADAYSDRLPEASPGLQYDDYEQWSRDREAASREREIDFWRQRLDPSPEELRLPFESKSAGPEVARGRLLGRSVDESVQRRIRDLAAATGATPFMVCAFAFRLLLQRYAEGRRFAFATPVSTRSHPATAEMIGYFLNPVLVTAVIDEARPVAEAVREFAGELRQALSHGSIPFQSLAEELAPPREPDRHPLFQVMFVHQETAPPPSLGNARLEPVSLDLGESKFDLTLFVTEAEGSFEIAVEYRVDRFDEAWMHSLLGHYETLLAGLPSGPERPAAAVSMLSSAERESLLQASIGDLSTVAGTALLPKRILEQARSSPRSPALICGGTRQDYGELAGSALATAQRLVAAGVEPGDRVGLFVDRSAGMIAGILGIHWAGAAYVPLDPGYPPARNRDVLEDADVAAVLTAAGTRERLSEGRWPVVDVAAGGEEAPSEPPAVEPTAESVAYVLYTSGSTGRPKGVVVTQGNLSSSNAARLAYYEQPPRRFLLVPSVAFDSSVAGIFWTLATGSTLVIPTEDEARDPRRLARLAADERVTCLLCVPSLYAALLASGGDQLQGLESAIVAGETCPPTLVEEHFRLLPRVRFFNEYGPTEATVWATVEEIHEANEARPVAIGRPVPGVQVHILDRLGRLVPAGIPGHAWISGPTVARGYWRRPELSEERFVAGAVPAMSGHSYRTGDRMAWTADRRLLFLGREDEQIKLRGFRIEPGEVEAALVALPGVERAGVVARPAAGSDPAGVRLVAFVEGSPPASWATDLAELLPGHMIPGRLVETAELPLLPNGKIDRRRLVEVRLAPEVFSGESAEITSDRVQALISLWEGLLGVRGIAPDDNFFELGGHSLQVVEMAIAIEHDLGVRLSAADVFANPTVRQLARRIEQRGGSRLPTYRHLFPIQPSGGQAPFVVALPHFFTEMFASRFRGERPVYGLRGVGLRQEGNLGRWRTMRELAEELVAEIERRFPDRPCILAGYSFGASMAFEAARLMEERGRPVESLYLIAPMPLDHYRVGPLRLQLDGLRRPVGELSTGEAVRLWTRSNNPLTRRPYQRLRRWLVIEPWRRLLCLVGKLRLLVGLPLTPRILNADVRVDRFRLHTRYLPGVVRTPTVFFNPREPETNAAATWRPWFQGPLTVVETPDPHIDDASVEDARRLILRQFETLRDEP